MSCLFLIGRWRKWLPYFYIVASTQCKVKSCQANHFFSQPAAAFKTAYESLKLDLSGAKSVSMLKIWHLIMVCLRVDMAITSIYIPFFQNSCFPCVNTDNL